MGRHSSSPSYILSFEGQQPYHNFVNTIKSVRTCKTYSSCLEGYIKYRKIVALVDRLDTLLTENPRQIEISIMSYLLSLKNEYDLGYAARNTTLSAIKHFYRMNDVEGINWYKISKVLGEYNRRVLNKRPYSMDEIQKIFAKADPRMRVVILLLTSTGMRVGALPDIAISHLKRIEKYALYMITVYAGSEEEYYTFCTPECAMEIDSYLEYRSRCGEKLTPSSPLVRNEFNKGDSLKTRNPRKVCPDCFGVLIAKLTYATGVQQEQHLFERETKSKRAIRKDTPRAHAFRIFFNTRMVEAKVNAEAREMLMGHTLGLNDAYYKPSANDILEEYIKAVDVLTISSENRLKQENEQLKAEKSQIKIMEDQVGAMQSQMQTLIRALESVDQTSKNELAKKMVQSGIFKPAEDRRHHHHHQ